MEKEPEVKVFVRRLLKALEKQNSWGKNQLKNLIIDLMLEEN